MVLAPGASQHCARCCLKVPVRGGVAPRCFASYKVINPQSYLSQDQTVAGFAGAKIAVLAGGREADTSTGGTYLVAHMP